MKKHHAVALTLAGITTALIAVDTVVRATTGEATFITDDTQGSIAAGIAISVLLGLTFGACAVVVGREAAAFAEVGKFLRGVRNVALASLTIGAAGQIVLHPIELAAGVDPEGPWAAVSGLVAMLGLLGAFLGALILGIASIRRNRFGVGGRVLGLLLPVIALTAALAAVAPSIASPVFYTAVVLLGFATIGLRVPQHSSLATPLTQAIS